MKRKQNAMTSKKPDPFAVDMDNPEWSEADIKAAMSPDEFTLKTGIKLPKRGRPRSDNKKIHTGLRLDADVLEYFKRGGKGWQTRINQALREKAGL